MAKSSTTTSIFRNYAEGRREIYGIKFSDGLKPNQEFPMGTIVTPTTKAPSGQHDEELTDDEARLRVDKEFGAGIWREAKEAALAVFERGRKECLEKGLMLVDTKYEFGIDYDGALMLIDEMHTPDSSRFWLEATYKDKFERGETPDTFDKEILRRWLAEQGFKGELEKSVPLVDAEIIHQMREAYLYPYTMITGEMDPLVENGQVYSSDAREIKDAALSELDRLQNAA